MKRISFSPTFKLLYTEDTECHFFDMGEQDEINR